jgi:outer membrane receptor protein involved in Fe transport
MKIRFIYILLTLFIACNIAPAYAQQKKHTKKTVRKPAPRKIAKPTPRKAKKPVARLENKRKTVAQKLGDEAANTSDDNGANKGQSNNGTLTEQVIVTTAYKPVLADAVKIRRNPTLEDTVAYKAPLSYATLDKRLELNSKIRQLDAMKMPSQKDTDYKNNYLKLAAGSLKTLYGEAYFNNGPDEALQFGGYLKHFSQSGNDFYNQNYSTNQAGIFGKTIGNVVSLDGKIDFKNQGVNFYGFDPASPPPVLNAAGQHFNVLSGQGKLLKNYKDVPNDFTYALKLSGYTYSDAYQAQENNGVLSGFINETVGQFYAGLTASADLTTQKDSLYNYTNNILRVNPYLKFQGDIYKIDAGINVVKAFGQFSSINVFPAAKLELQVIPKYVRLFAEIKGDVDKASIYDLATGNPFIDQNVALKNSIDRLDIAAGLKGTLAPGLSFKADVYRNSVKDLPLFVSTYNATQHNYRFNVVYDNGNAQVEGINGEIDFKPGDAFNLYGRVEVKQYNLASQAEPWNLPKFKMTAGTEIHIADKVIVNGALVIRGSTYDEVTTGTATKTVTLNSFADVNGGVEYRITNKISIFGQVNNLLDTKYQTWLNFQNYGISVFGGAKFSF